MKFLDRMILGIFSILMLLMAVFSSLIIFGWLNITTLYIFGLQLLQNQIVCNILIGINVFIIILAIKAIFFESKTDDDKYESTDGILLENEDGKLLITKETLKNMTNSVVSKFDSVKNSQTKIILDKNNDLYITITLDVADNAIIKDLSNNIQIRIKEVMKNSLDVEIKSLDIRVRNIINTNQETKED
jgi:uncharacterized alkaline shock family protein YloU